jgi:di/tricarboxylate transporter
MNTETLFVFALLGLTMLLFVTERLRMDLVALLVVLVLMLSEILTPTEALAGFSDPVVLMIAGLFVVGGGLFQTGVAHAIGQGLTHITGSDESSLIGVTMVAVALLSAFLSSAGATAVLIPVAVNMAWRAKISPSKTLLPLAVGSLLGGLLTLIGTPPNLVVSNELAAHGLPPFGFLSFTPIGVLVLALGVSFMLVVGRRLLPAEAERTPGSSGGYDDTEVDESLSMEELAETYQLPAKLYRMRVRSSSPLVNMTVSEANLRERFGVNVLEAQSWPERKGAPEEAQPVEPETRLHHNDILHVQGDSDDVTGMAQELRLGILQSLETEEPLLSDELGMVELLLPPRSQLVGRTLKESRFRDKYNVTVLSVRRMGEPLPAEESAETPLRFGDTLLVLGTWRRIALLRDEQRNFIVVGLPKEMLEQRRTTKRALLAALIMVGMLVLMTFQIVPAVTAVLLAAALMVLTDSLTMEQAYGAMNWQSIFLLAGMLPMATALQKTGGVEVIARALTSNLGSFGPVAVMAGLFLLTALFSQFISNTATTVLVAPIAYQAAVSLGVAPQPFLMAVAVAASTAFATPVATMSTTMVMAPGGYRFEDYLRLGLGLQVLVLLLTLLVLPVMFPFG